LLDKNERRKVETHGKKKENIRPEEATEVAHKIRGHNLFRKFLAFKFQKALISVPKLYTEPYHLLLATYIQTLN
jgi:hypothetical protein